MATNTLIQNIMLPILNADETPFHGLSLKRFAVDSVVMSLGDKITGDVFYKDNTLHFTMREYVVYNGVKYTMINPPTVVREGMVGDNGELKGMTKYSLEFYHPMYQLSNLPFSDVAVSSSEQRYLSENKTFSWCGKPNDFIAKLNKNLEGTQWIVEKSSNFPESVNDTISDVLSFDKATIADALKTMYDTWKLPYIIDVVKPTEPAYAQNKFFKVIVGMPCEEIYPSAAAGVTPSPYIFRFGEGVGLKNNSRSPRNNKIVTRISGYGSERNIPYGYPQVIWYGNQTWKYTINNDSTNPLSYPIYDGIVGGKWVKLIKHPFTRAHLMPKVYVEKLFNKVSPYAVKELPPIPPYSKVLEDLYASIDNKLANYTQAGPVNNGFIDLKETIQTVVANGVAGTYEFGDAGSLQYEGKVVLSDDGMLSGEMYADDNYYPKFDGYTFSKVWVNDNSATYQNPNYNPQIELVDYYDAIGEDYPNNINTLAPSYDTHEFEEVYPKLGDVTVVGVQPITTDYIQFSEIGGVFDKYISMSSNDDEKAVITSMKTEILGGSQYNRGSGTVGEYEYSFSYTSDEEFLYIEYKSNLLNFKIKSLNDGVVPPEVKWDDTMDEDGNYKQSYFKITLPILSFDLYASASITEKMDIYMRSGACIGCTFPVQVDWDDYKQNFFSADGKFLPDGPQRDIVKYPKSNEKSITIAVQKDKDTFGTLMPNAYQKPQAGDKFVILGISLPLSYITTAEEELENAAKAYMLENNIYYFDYPLKLDEFFLTNNKPILDQIKPNSIMRFDFAGEEKILYVKQITSKYGFTPLPQYEITLTDNIEVSLNQIGQTVDDLDKLTGIVNSLRDQNNQNLLPAIAKCLSKVDDDTAQGFIRFIKGLQVGDSFVSGILGSGGVFRMDADGTSYIEVDKMYVRMKAYFDNVEVREYKHLSGNRVVTQAGAKSCRVEWVDSQGNYLEQLEQNLNSVVKFRCFFRATDGEDSIKNGFLLGDLVYCHVTSVRGGIDNPEQKGLNTKHYWRLCVGRNEEGTLTSDGEAWIDLSNRTEEYIEQEDEHGETVLVAYRGFQSGSDVPEAQDSMIQLGNVNDQDRQGAIIEFVTGSNSPTYQIYQGIGSDRTNIYSLNNKNQISFGYNSQTGHAYMNVFGDMYFGDPNGSTYIKYEQENPQTHRPLLKIKAVVEFQSPDSQWTTLEEFAAAVMGDIENLQDQVDGQIETWFYDYDPTLQNAPASDWDTDDEKNNHLGDLFYNTEKGYAWRWGRTEEEGSYVYQWFRIEDTDVVRALADAARAQDTADHKRRVFTATPYSPYDAGDLWVNATYPAGYTGETDEAQHKYNNEILKCISPIPRTENGHEVNTFSINDWSLADGSTSKLKKFITDTYNPFVQNIKDQVDKKAETWYQDADPSTAWTTATLKNEHVGDIWCNTADGEGHKTYVYTANENPTTHAISYSWEEMDVPDEVFDQIDGKASIFVQKPTEYGSNDLWIIEASNITCPENDIPNGCKRGDIVIADNVTSEDGKRTEYNKADWHKKDRYTDDTALNAFINGDYATFARNIQSQVDRKAETWYQTTDPSLAWTTAALQQAHVGDIWHNSSQITINNVEAGQDAIWNGSSWVVSTVPSEVYDQIDGKSSIYVQKPTTYEAKDLWIIGSDVSSYDMPSGCQMGDIVISSTSRTNNYNKNDWGKKDRYTDDTKFDGFINQILNTSGGGSSEGDVAHALGVIKAALNQGTTINGGLVLSTLIGLRDGDNVLWSGISGQYMSQETGAGYKGHGIASWYGGGMRDWEVYKENGGTGTLDSTFAKSLFRFDGSGYLASGNISWDKNGTVRIANVYGDTLNDLANLASNLPITLRDGEPYFNPLLGFTQLNVLGSPVLTQDSAENNFVSKAYLNSMFTKTQSGNTEYILPQLSFYSINVQGSPVATESWVNSNYVSIQFFENLFNAFDSSGNVVHPNSNSAIDNIKAMVGLWTNQYLSALGLNSSGSGGGGGEGVSWTDLAGSTTEQINLSHLRAVTNNYATKQTAVTGMVIDGNNYRLYRGDNSSFTVPVGGVLKIRIGTSTVDYTPSSGTVILPAYPDVQIPTDYWHTGDTRAVHTVLAAPVDGDGVASFRTLQHTDLPGLPANKIISGTFDVDRIPQLPASKISGLDLDFLPSSGGTVTGNINVTNDVTIGGILVLKYSSSVSQRLYCDSSGNLYDGYGQLAHMSDIGGGSSADIATKTWVNSQGFATQSWVTRQGYLTSSNTYVDTTNNTVTINGTTISVSGGGGGGGGAYLPLTGGTLTGFLNVEYDNFRVRVLNDRIRFAALSGGQESISTELTIETSLISSYSGRLKVGNNVLAYVSELPNLASYATQTWVQQQNYVTASALASALTSYAYITPATGTITIGSNSINVNSGLGNYLPLTGGTMANTNLVRNMNAEFLNGYSINELTLAVNVNDYTDGENELPVGSECVYFNDGEPLEYKQFTARTRQGTTYDYIIFSNCKSALYPTTQTSYPFPSQLIVFRKLHSDEDYYYLNTYDWEDAPSELRRLYFDDMFLSLEGGTVTGYITASGFIKAGSSSAYVLTGDGGHALISELTVSYANYAGNASYATQASSAATATTARYLSGGTTGSIPYQVFSNTTQFLAPPSTNDYILAFNTATGAPYWRVENVGSNTARLQVSDTTNKRINTLESTSNYIQFTGGTNQFTVSDGSSSFNVGITVTMPFGNLTGIPSTIAGYGITDAFVNTTTGTVSIGGNSISFADMATQTWVGNNFLSLSGGVVRNANDVQLYVQCNSTTGMAAIGFKHYSSGTTAETMGFIGMNTKDGNLMRGNGAGSTWYNILDSNNSSVSLSGQTLTVKINGTEKSLTNTNTWRGIQDNLTSDSATDSLSAKQGKALAGRLTTVEGYFTNGYANVATFANTSGAAQTATKLATARSIWGQSFDGSANVTGTMSSVTNIDSLLYFDTTNSRIGIGTTTPSYKLDVNGSFNATSGNINGNAIIHAGNIGSQSVSYATSAGSAPASDVYAWAKAANKPSYSLSEISGRQQSLIEWGGPNLVGGVSPIEVATIDDLGHNKLAFASAATITIQYSRDNGATWTSYGASDTDRRALLTLTSNYSIGGRTGASNTVNDKLRVILNSNNAGGNIYTILRRLLLYISTAGSGGCSVKVEHRTIANYRNSVDTWREIGTFNISGWPGWNSIPCAVTFGGDNSQTTQSAQIRLTFGVTSVSSTSNNLKLIAIRGIGYPLWISPSTLATTGHLYSFDMSQNAAFPANVSATAFVKSGSDDNHVLLGGGGHADISTLGVGYAATAGSAQTAVSAATATTATNATHLAGGAAGSIPYQATVNATQFVAAPTTDGYVLAYSVTNGAPYWKADANTNTWRGIYTNGTIRVGNGTDGGFMNFVGGSNVSVSYEAAGTGSGQSGNADYFNIKIAATGLVTSVKVGNTSYSPSNGVVSLPAYPTDYWKTGDTRTQNTFLAAPNGSNGAASFRRIEIEDIPDISESYLSTSGGTVDGDITATTFIGNLNGQASYAVSSGSSMLATSATNIAGGAAGSIPYQTAAGTTAFVAASANNGYILAFNTSTNTPYWKSDNNSNSARLQVSDTTHCRINTMESTSNYLEFSGGANKIIISDGTNSFDVFFTPSVTFPVTSVVGQTGAVTTAQIASALTGAGYKLTDTVYTLPTASSTVLGGVKVGNTLAISSGVLNLVESGVTAGTYKRVTVDAYGRVTYGDNVDSDTNTWRNIYTGGTSRVGTGTNTKAINFVAANNITVSYLAAGTGSGQSGSADYFTIKLDGTHTHNIDLATSSDTNQVTLAHGTKYKLTAGGASIVFTMPTDNNTDVNVKVNTTNPTTGTWYYPVWYTAVSGTGNVNANDGLRYYSLEGTASALGYAYLQLGNATAGGTAKNKKGLIRLMSSTAYYGDLQVTDLTANKTYTLPSDDGTILTSGNSSVSLSGDTLTVKINGVSKSLTNTWRGITDVYNTVSPSSTVSLSQAGAKALYDSLGSAISSMAYFNSITWQENGKLKFSGHAVEDTIINFSHTHNFSELTGAVTNSQLENSYITINGTIVNLGGSMSISTTDNTKLPLTGGTMTGTIYRAYSASNQTPFLWINGDNYDNYIWQVSCGTTTKQYYGFGLKYLGTGSDNDNKLVLYADNQNRTNVAAYSITQDGVVTFGVTPKVGTSTIITSGTIGSQSVSYASYAESATSATTATNIAGGAQGSIPYQTAAGTTAFLAGGTGGYVLAYDATNKAPYWKADANTNTWRGVYTDGTIRVGNGTDGGFMNFVGGSNVSVSYEAAGTGTGKSGSGQYFNIKIAATDTTYTIATGDANGQIKVTPSIGNAYNVDVKGVIHAGNIGSQSVATATNIAGGAQGSIPYQTAAGTTAFLAASANNDYVLAYNTTTHAPYWKAISGGGTDTWRNIYTGGTSRVGTATNTKAINFVGYNGVNIRYEAAGTGTGQSGSSDYFNVKIGIEDSISCLEYFSIYDRANEVNIFEFDSNVITLNVDDYIFRDPATNTNIVTISGDNSDSLININKTTTFNDEAYFYAYAEFAEAVLVDNTLAVGDDAEFYSALSVTGATTLSGDVLINGGANQHVAIGIAIDNDYKLKANGSLYFSGNNATMYNYTPYTGIGYWQINGSGGASIECNGTVTATAFNQRSDARMKDVVDNMALVDVNTIAMAPAVRYRWKDGEDKDLHCGTLAQYWDVVMPECVNHGYDGYLSLQYDVIALLAAISVAKKVVDHEQRITELERENERLRTELEQLRLNMEA